MPIFESFLSTPEVTEALSDRNFVAAMLRFQAALARAQAAVGLIPADVAQSIVGTCKVELFDVLKLVRESGRTRCLATPLVDSLRETVALFNPAAAAFVSFGCSHQDVIDSAMALVTGDALALIEVDVAHAVSRLLKLAAQHASDPLLARNPMQAAAVTCFGLKCAQWATPLVRSQQRLASVKTKALTLQLGGTAGTLAEIQELGPRVIARMADELQLKAPVFFWHTERDEWTALACELGLLTGSLGNIATDMALMAQAEVAELSDPTREPGRNSAATHSLPAPSLQPNIDTTCMVVLAAAQRVPQRVASLLAGLPQQHESGLGNWQAGLAEWPALLLSVHGAARAISHLLASMQVNTQQMLRNLDSCRASLTAREATERLGTERIAHAAQLTSAHLNFLQAMLETAEPV